jgi:hypothetical protein
MRQIHDCNAMVVYAKDKAIFQTRALQEHWWYAIEVDSDLRSTSQKPSQIDYIYFHLRWEKALVYRAKVKDIILCSDDPRLNTILNANAKDLKKCVIRFDEEAKRIEPIIARTKGSKERIRDRRYIYHERVTATATYDSIFITTKP